MNLEVNQLAVEVTASPRIVTAGDLEVTVTFRNSGDTPIRLNTLFLQSATLVLKIRRVDGTPVQPGPPPVPPLDDGRVARAYARTAAKVKGRGRLRVARELQAMGIARDVIAAAVGEVFGDADERAMIDRAIQKKLRGGRKPATVQERARIYQFLLRQGFTPAAVSSALRRLGGTSVDE